MTGTPRADVWLLLGHGVEESPVAARLRAALAEEFGPRCAVVRTADLLLGVRTGRLTLHALDGTPVAAPRVVLARMMSPGLGADREITLLRHLEALGAVLVNPIDSVMACVNKVWQLQQLALAGLPVPDTLSYADAPLEAVIDAPGMVPEPCVVKAVRGHRGRRVFLAPDTAMLRDVQGSLRHETPYLFQEYVAHSHGRDLRVVVVDGRAVAAQTRTGDGTGLTSNLARGGTATQVLGRHPRAEALAVRAAEVLGLAVAGVDLLFLPDGDFVLCEVNANVGWTEAMAEVAPAVTAACAARLTRGTPSTG
ncbi:RimK family alpha-L-glutamate ligase [Streptomyces sp. NPDC046977]|uniref:RimK family alpha-L-glutamate ligase n=1 Tax=Streptomyces sp. NPDC046977 TaxID=3154703 RepID=UPI0033C868B1